ncbi:MAG TPA: hypothetical protein VKD67_05085, partial [Acidimicrobiales bacterium]|nr:hypothetical protein [Acidimicrobiales bacterium]
VGGTSIVPFGRTHILRVPTTTAEPDSARRRLHMGWTVITGTDTPRLVCRWRAEANPAAPTV